MALAFEKRMLRGAVYVASKYPSHEVRNGTEVRASGRQNSLAVSIGIHLAFF